MGISVPYRKNPKVDLRTPQVVPDRDDKPVLRLQKVSTYGSFRGEPGIEYRRLGISGYQRGT